MKLDVKNKNYCATIIKVHNLLELENCNNVVGFPIFGYQAIVGKDTKIAQLGILFTAETQLSEDFCRENNLFRKKELNKTPEKIMPYAQAHIYTMEKILNAAGNNGKEVVKELQKCGLLEIMCVSF